MQHAKSIIFPMVLIFLLAATAGHSQERETVSLAELQSVYDTVKEIASATAERRQNIGTEEGAKAFLRGVVEDQKLLEPAMVSIATTNSTSVSHPHGLKKCIHLAYKVSSCCSYQHVGLHLPLLDPVELDTRNCGQSLKPVGLQTRFRFTHQPTRGSEPPAGQTLRNLYQ